MAHLIFDWSGTILDALPASYEACMRIFDRMNHKRIPLEQFRREINIPYMKFWNSYFPDMKKEDEEKMYVEEISKLNNSKIYPGVRECIKKLNSKHLLSVVSSDPTERILSEANKGGIKDYFCDIVGWCHEKTPKIRELYLKRKIEAFYIGDTTGDINSARDAGTHTIAITWGYHPRDKLMTSNPDHIIEKLSDIESILNHR